LVSGIGDGGPGWAGGEASALPRQVPAHLQKRPWTAYIALAGRPQGRLGYGDKRLAQ
jgi:hypothetical protein